MKTVWIDIDTAEPKQMQLAFAQERNRILAKLCQIKNDIDHYNDYKNKGKEPLIFVFDFTEDIAEYMAADPRDRIKWLRAVERDSV